jgi:hypothetical protein
MLWAAKKGYFRRAAPPSNPYSRTANGQLVEKVTWSYKKQLVYKNK